MATFGEYFKQTISSILTSYPPPDFIGFFYFSKFSSFPSPKHYSTHMRMPCYAPDNVVYLKSTVVNTKSYYRHYSTFFKNIYMSYFPLVNVSNSCWYLDLYTSKDPKYVCMDTWSMCLESELSNNHLHSYITYPPARSTGSTVLTGCITDLLENLDSAFSITSINCS